jgi:hypothetical protein
MKVQSQRSALSRQSSIVHFINDFTRGRSPEQSWARYTSPIETKVSRIENLTEKEMCEVIATATLNTNLWLVNNVILEETSSPCKTETQWISLKFIRSDKWFGFIMVPIKNAHPYLPSVLRRFFTMGFRGAEDAITSTIPTSTLEIVTNHKESRSQGSQFKPEFIYVFKNGDIYGNRPKARIPLTTYRKFLKRRIKDLLTA